MKYYWCVDCGYNGVFEFYRMKNIKCESCGYEHPCEFSEEEWLEEGMDVKHEEDKKNPYYDGSLKYKTKVKIYGKN